MEVGGEPTEPSFLFRLAGSPTTLGLQNQPERRPLEVPIFGVRSPQSTGLAISASTEVLQPVASLSRTRRPPE